MNETLSPIELAEEGKKAYQQGKYYEAATAFQASAKGYEAADDQLNAAEMLNNCSVALLKGKDPETALQAVEGTEQVFATAGDKKRQAMTIGNRAAVLEALKRYDEALLEYDRAAVLFKEIGEQELRVPIMKSIAALQLRTGKSLESLASFDASLGEVEGLSAWQRFWRKIARLPMKIITRT
jgi:tetratricopeptide (TPR) repeat protein